LQLLLVHHGRVAGQADRDGIRVHLGKWLEDAFAVNPSDEQHGPVG
jgi:hypothetical protein